MIAAQQQIAVDFGLPGCLSSVLIAIMRSQGDGRMYEYQ